MSKKIAKADFHRLKDYDNGQLFRLTTAEHDTPVLEIANSAKEKSRETSRETRAICTLHPELFLKRDKGLGKVRGVTSPTQSSKTQWMVAQALLALSEGRSAIIVPRNFVGDQIQLRARVQSIEESVSKILGKYRVKCMTCLSSCSKESTKRREGFRKGGYLFIALANSVQLENLVNDITPRSYDLFIDEADASDYGKESKSREDVKRAVAFDVLKSKSHRTFCISATLMGVVMNEKGMLSSDLIRLTPPGDYRGFMEVAANAKVLKHGIHGCNKFKSWNDRIAEDKNLLPFLLEFSQREPHLIGVGRTEGPVLHPQICLLNVTTSVSSHASIVEGIASHSELGDRLVVIGVNGKGIAIHMPGDEDVYEFSLKGDDKEPLLLEPCQFNRNTRLTISSVLQFIYERNNDLNEDHGDIEGWLQYGNIVIVSGRCVGRGISVVSQNYKYHLPTMYFTPSPTMNIPNLIQAMGRLCGRNLGKAPLELWATAEVWDCLHRGLLCEEELLNRAVGKPLIIEGKEQPLADSVCDIPINRAKIPLARRSLTKGSENTRETLNLVTGEDGGRDLKDYMISDGDTNLPVTLTSTLEKMFKKWSNPKNNNKIARTARSIDPSKVYAVKDWPEDWVRLGDITISEQTLKSHRHKPFMMRTGEMAQVHPKLVEIYEQYF